MKARLAKTYKQHGFTMIELIVVIIILAIMAVTVLPKFFNSTGFQEFTYQSEAIAKLRAIQIRAMQQTNTGLCHKVVVTSTALGLPKNCDDSVADGWESDSTSVVIQPNHSVSFAFSTGSVFTFDGFGRPSCSPCVLNVNGDSALTVVIESEGYIHAN